MVLTMPVILALIAACGGKLSWGFMALALPRFDQTVQPQLMPALGVTLRSEEILPPAFSSSVGTGVPD